MIVPMLKATILCMAERRDAALEALRDLGMLHVTLVRHPEGEDLEAARQWIEQLRAAVATLSAARREAETESEPGAEAADARPEDLVDQVGRLAARRAEYHDRMQEIDSELARIEPFGEFDPDLARELENRGIRTSLLRASLNEEIFAPEGLVLSPIVRRDNRQWFALVGPADRFPEDLPYDLVAMPEKNAEQLHRMGEEIESEDIAVAEHLLRLSGGLPALEHALADAVENEHFVAIRRGMGEDRQVAYLQGFCPKPRAEALRSAAAENGWALLLDEPDPDEEVPTLMSFPRWVKPIKAAFDALDILPAYREADISIVFLIFFSIFYAMLIGDAGYGVIFLAGTWVARLLMPKAPRYPFALLTILNVCMIAWGVLTGNYFGMDTPALLGPLQVEWLSQRENVMNLAFLIGVIHLSIAHIWNAVVMLPNDKRGYAQVGWLMIAWTMYFAARGMVLNFPFPPFAYALSGIGLLLIILFMTPVRQLKQDWILHVMLPLNVVSALVDLISYVRLFAVGMASYAVANSFNQMALMVGFSDLVGGFLAALILVFGHTLNIILCALAVLVHGVRLNTLEFSQHKEMTWSGFAFNPFRRRESS